MRIGTEAGNPGPVAGFLFSPDAAHGVSLRNAEKFIKAGSSVECQFELHLKLLIKAGAKPSAIILMTQAVSD